MSEIDSKNIVGALFLDLKKAFDTLNHKILLDKLECYGIRGVANSVIQSYLTNRKQFVTVDGERSTLAPIEIGVPQGSNIGPLLFLLFINDLGNLHLNGTPRLFADDTALCYPDNDINNIISAMDNDLSVLDRYFNANLLSLNISKTKYMVFRSQRKTLPTHHHPKLGQHMIENVNCFKYLGIHLDQTLSWTEHIKSVERLVASSCGILWRVKSFVPQRVLLNYYFAFIHSQLNYIISVWGRAASSHLKKIQSLQNRCLKTIFKKPLLYSTLLLYSDNTHNIQPIVHLCETQTLLFVHDNLHNTKAHHNIQFPTFTRSRPTRNNNNLQRIRAVTTLGQKRIVFIGPTKYNSLPLDIQRIENRSIFKARLKCYFKQKLSELFH